MLDTATQDSFRCDFSTAQECNKAFLLAAPSAPAQRVTWGQLKLLKQDIIVLIRW